MIHAAHDFQESTKSAELRTKVVLGLTALMMTAEIIAGTLFNSMALLADGWHMGTHTTAFLIAVAAYFFARKHRGNRRFSFGTGKIGVLGGFTSSILLLVVALAMISESVERLLNPSDVLFAEALLVALVGLAVNVVCAFILKDTPDHSHDHAHGHDKNLKAAYLHVIADAFTSVTAIAALIVGSIWGIVWMDSVMGFLGSIVIIIWALGMIRETVAILLDYTPASCDLEAEIIKAFGALENTKLNDLHIWQIASGKYAAIISIETDRPKKLEEYYRLVNVHEELVHVSIQMCN